MAPVEFAAKLRLTAIALRCNSRKELCARFRAVNPATHCDVDRMHKWMQGRALPRSAQVLDDLAKVLGSARSGAWLARCSLEAFTQEVSAATGLAEEELRGELHEPAAPAPVGIAGGLRSLAGRFACYSPAWSPHYRGQLVRGSLAIAPGNGGQAVVTYGEALAGRQVRTTGPLVNSGRVVHALMHEPDGNLPLFLVLHVPGSPASVMTGILAGVAFLSHDPLPAGCCFVAVRVDDDMRLEPTNRYLEFTGPAIAADLAALGLPAALAAQAGPAIAEILAGEPRAADTSHQRALSELLDRRFLI